MKKTELIWSIPINPTSSQLLLNPKPTPTPHPIPKMPAKIDAEANLRFLYVCFKHSNFSTIDYHKVAAHFQIKAPAARMRLMRLRMALEGESSKDHRGKRGSKEDKGGKGKAYVFYDDEDDDEALDNLPLADRMKLRLLRIKREEGVKREDGWERGIKREFDWEGVKQEEDKEEEEDDKGRVNLEPFDGTACFKTEGVGDIPPHGVKMEQDIKTESDTGRFAYPAPFTFAPTTPAFSNLFSQFKTEPEVAFPRYHNQNHSPQPNTTTEFPTPQTNQTSSLAENAVTNTTYRTDSPMLETETPHVSQHHPKDLTSIDHNFANLNTNLNTTPQPPFRHPSSSTDTPMLENQVSVKHDAYIPQSGTPESFSIAAHTVVENDDVELADRAR